MTLREAKIRARIARLQNELRRIAGEDEGVKADGASAITADTLPEPPEFNAGEDGCRRSASAREAMRRAIRRRAMLRDAGVEDRINQNYLTNMEAMTHRPAGVDPSIRTKLRHASVSLDRIADQLEKQGKVALAYRVDRVADEIDARLAKLSK